LLGQSHAVTGRGNGDNIMQTDPDKTPTDSFFPRADRLTDPAPRPIQSLEDRVSQLETRVSELETFARAILSMRSDLSLCLNYVETLAKLHGVEVQNHVPPTGY
jgi:hypothetical protein